MLTSEVWISIPGHPHTKGSMKCIGRVGNRAHVLVEDHKSAKPWLDAVTRWCKEKLAVRHVAAGGQPLGVEATFTIPRPKSHYGTGRNGNVLKPAFVDARPTGHNTGDADKLVRVVLDALQSGGVIPNDSAVCELTSRKAYQLPPGEDRSADDVLPYAGVVIRLYPI